MAALLLSIPVLMTFAVVASPSFDVWVRHTGLLSWISTGDGTTLHIRMAVGASAFFLISLLIVLLVLRRLVRLAFDPQLNGALPDDLERQLRDLAGSRKPGRLIDPDYRLTGWNKSRFAPKKSGNTMRDKAVSSGTLAGGLVSLAAIPVVGLASAVILGYCVFALSTCIVAANTRRHAWNEVKNDITETYLKAEAKRELLRPVFDESSSGEPHSRGVIRFDTTPTTTAYQEFEREVAYLIHRQTGLRTEVVGGAGDGGVDIRVLSDDQLVGVVQCKYYAPHRRLDPSIVREMYAVKMAAGVKTAYLVTTARFTDNSRSQAQRFGINLIDGDDLARIRRRVYATSPKPATRPSMPLRADHAAEKRTEDQRHQ